MLGKRTALFLFASALMTGPVLAAPAAIDAAKAECIVGERVDGYLGIIDDRRADTALRREVRDVNQKRSAAYADVAARTGVTTAITAKAAAVRLINNAPSGHCVQNMDQQWVRVP
jgi:uncharacterized protein YdbL (DUF1318 family)